MKRPLAGGLDELPSDSRDIKNNVDRCVGVALTNFASEVKCGAAATSLPMRRLSHRPQRRKTTMAAPTDAKMISM
jgi:hypothetical protein